MSSSVLRSKSACTVCGRCPQTGSFTITVTGSCEPTPMQYTLTPYVCASRAAVSGSTSPALLTPSVSRMTTFSLAVELLRRATASASPFPIAVREPSSVPIRRRSITAFKTSRSSVSGQSVMAPLPKTTSPMRSPLRCDANSAARCLAALIRSGWRSGADIDSETSRQSMMSTPCDSISSNTRPRCGRASATTASTSAAALSARTTSRSQRPKPCCARRNPASEKRTVAVRLPSSSQTSSATGTSSQSQAGEARRMSGSSPGTGGRGAGLACRDRLLGLGRGLRLHHEVAELLERPLGLVLGRHGLRVLHQVAPGEEARDLVAHRQLLRAHARQQLGRGLLDRVEPVAALEVAFEDLGEPVVEPLELPFAQP